MSPRRSCAERARRSLRTALRALLLALAAGSSASLLARSPNYRLEIDAPEELREALDRQTLLGRWREDPDFEPAQLAPLIARGAQEAEAIAQAAGWFSSRVSIVEAAPQEGLPVIRISVDAGARATVGKLQLAITGVDPDLASRLADAWPLPEGSFFRTTDWENGKRQLLDQLQQHGHLRARVVDSLAEVDAGTTAASLALRIEAGPRLAFGPLRIRGLERYPASIVEDLRPFREGDPYAYDQLLAFQDRLRAERWFAGASVLPDLEAVEAEPAADRVPILVELRERQRQALVLGVGYGTDQGVRAVATHEHRDLLGRGWVLESGALVETVRHRAYASASTPWDGRGGRWQAGLRTERLDVSGETTDRRTVYFGRGWRTGAVESFASIQYQAERAAVDAGGTETATARSAALTLGYAWLLRELDSRVDPRRGYTVSAQVSGAAKGLGSDRSFTRVYARAMRFWPVPDGQARGGGVLVGLVELGQVASGGRDGIPGENLFRAGGAQSVRGYPYLGLGPRIGDAVVGGRVLAVASLEYQHPIVADWHAAAFVDVGNAADRWADWKPVRGTGVGLRWRSPVGPVNLDVAHGDTDRRWRVHFSVGYSF